MLDNDPVDPIKEMSKQFYRDNPQKAVEHTAIANLFIIGILVISVVGGLVANAADVPSDISTPAIVVMNLCFAFWVFNQIVRRNQ